MASHSAQTRIELSSFPYYQAQTIMKARLKGAQTGRNLLKKKSDALTLRFRQILKKIIETKMLMGEVMREAAFSLAEAKFTAGDFSTTVIQNVNKAQVKIRAKKDNVAGVTLPVFEHYHEGTDSYELTGLARGGEQLAKLKRNYAKAVELLVELASLQSSFPGLNVLLLISSQSWMRESEKSSIGLLKLTVIDQFLFSIFQRLYLLNDLLVYVL
uniref:V-type proton ATPase subunit D n=1 Tax=Colobus angolensis palliatus TaxID=336983 RepID=A0A2K5HBD4_COLAP